MINRLVISLCLVLLLCSPLQASEDRALFWRVQSNAATVYLMGSIHFADNSFYPLRGEIERAFEMADHLVVEINMTPADIAQYKTILETRGVYADDKTIEDHVSRKTYRQLLKRLDQLDIPLAHVNKQKPGILVMTLTSVQVMRMGFDPALGIDLHFLNRAKNQKNVIALETLEEQVNIFLDMPDGDLLLQESLHSMDDTEKLMNEMVDVWKRGDVAALNDMLFEDTLEQYPVFGSIYDRLFYRRNDTMTAAIKKFLASDESYFVVVGAGHLVGDKGIVNLLRQSGFSVERL